MDRLSELSGSRGIGDGGISSEQVNIPPGFYARPNVDSGRTWTPSREAGGIALTEVAERPLPQPGHIFDGTLLEAKVLANLTLHKHM